MLGCELHSGKKEKKKKFPADHTLNSGTKSGVDNYQTLLHSTAIPSFIQKKIGGLGGCLHRNGLEQLLYNRFPSSKIKAIYGFCYVIRFSTG